MQGKTTNITSVLAEKANTIRDKDRVTRNAEKGDDKRKKKTTGMQISRAYAPRKMISLAKSQPSLPCAASRGNFAAEARGEI